MIDSEEARAALALSCLPGVGPKRFRALIERHGSARAALGHAARKRRTAGDRPAEARAQADALLERLASAGVAVLPQSSPRFPLVLLLKPRMSSSFVPPYLTVRGDLPSLLARPRVAIVGASRASPAGCRLAGELAGALAERGIVVVSGYARGIDIAAHVGALAAGGASLAVVPYGILRHYPRPELAALDNETQSRLVVVSEFHPDEPWNSGAALQRNGTVVALSDTVVAVESEAAGGTMNTCRKAREFGRSVWTFRWPEDHPLRAGPETLVTERRADLLGGWPPDADACALELERAIKESER